MKRKGQMESDEEVLDELRSIIRGVRGSCFSRLNKYLTKESREERVREEFEFLQKIGLVQPYEEFKSNIEGFSFPSM